MPHEFELRLVGPRAKLGEVPAEDVARLLLGISRAIAYGSASVVGRPLGSRGKRPKAIADASRVVVVGIREGSVIPVLAIPDGPPPPGFGIDSPPLGLLGLREVVRAAANPAQAHPDVAAAVAVWGYALGIGTTYESLGISLTSDEGQPRVEVTADSLRSLSERADAGPRLTTGNVEGVLVEADFEANKGHVRSIHDRRIRVDYPPELADEIQDAIRQRRSFLGEVEYDADGRVIESVRVTGIQRQPAIWEGLEPGDFWSNHTVEELRTLQGATASQDVSELAIQVTDEEAEAFLAALGL